MFPDYINFYEIGWLVFVAGLILYGFFLHDGRWKITVRVIVAGACLLWIFFAYQMLDVQGDESITSVLEQNAIKQKDSKQLLAVRDCSRRHKDDSTTEFLECIESEKARMVNQLADDSRAEVCNKFYKNMLPSEKKVFDVARCLTDENYDPAIHKKELVAEEKYEGNFELYEKAMRKMELDKLIELKMLRDANERNRQKPTVESLSQIAILENQIEVLELMQNRQYYQNNMGTNNYAQCLIDKGSFVGCDFNYQRPVEVDVNVSGEIDLNLDIN